MRRKEWFRDRIVNQIEADLTDLDNSKPTHIVKKDRETGFSSNKHTFTSEDIN